MTIAVEDAETAPNSRCVAAMLPLADDKADEDAEIGTDVSRVALATELWQATVERAYDRGRMSPCVVEVAVTVPDSNWLAEARTPEVADDAWLWPLMGTDARSVAVTTAFAATATDDSLTSASRWAYA